MIVLNFSHPLTDEQRTQLESITEQSLETPIRRQASFDNDRDFGPQIAELADSCELDGDAWQTEPILIVPPALNAIAVLLLAELHGRSASRNGCTGANPATCICASPHARA